MIDQKDSFLGDSDMRGLDTICYSTHAYVLFAHFAFSM